jgi:hypothetical protein
MKSVSAKKINRNSEISEPSRMISLNLSDLKTIGRDGDPYLSENDMEISEIEMSLPINDPEEYVQLQLKEVNQYEQNYKNSLEILFQKAQGTNYESVIKKLYHDRENSNLQLDHDQEKFQINQLFNPENQKEKKTSNLNFQFRQRSRASTPTPEEQQKIDLILSKPLPRNMWQV